MPIKTPTFKAKPAELADWVEVRTLAAPDGAFRISRLKRFWDTHREREESDPEGLMGREKDTDEDGVDGADDDVFMDAIADELSDRENALGKEYPFEFQGTRFCLKKTAAISNGGYCYLFCLLLTNCKEGDIFDGTWLPDVNHVVRDLFQVCSTLAAAGEVQGSAISFGWPRPIDNPPFLEKLKVVYEALGEGTCVASPRPGVSPSVKDAEIDLIAWRPRSDHAAGKEYLLGQVASGDNWTFKSIKGGPIDAFHRDWFTHPPVSQPSPSIFIPHAVPPVGEGNRRDRIDSITAMYGRIFDRLILPFVLSKGIALADGDSGHLIIERRNEFPLVVTWVNSQVAALRAIGVGAL